jgi:hypothetical protein
VEYREKRLKHSERGQWKGFSPVCVRSCLVKCSWRRKAGVGLWGMTGYLFRTRYIGTCVVWYPVQVSFKIYLLYTILGREEGGGVLLLLACAPEK